LASFFILRYAKIRTYFTYLAENLPWEEKIHKLFCLYVSRSKGGLVYLSEAKWFKNAHPETIEEEPLIIELEVEDLMVVWPDGLVYPVAIAVRSHIVELNNEKMKNEGKQTCRSTQNVSGSQVITR
jgi:hypothetical protein